MHFTTAHRSSIWRPLRRILTAAAAVGTAVVLASPAYAAGPMGINGFTFHGTSTTGPTQAQIHALAQAGAGWVRVEFNTAPFGNTDSAAFYTAYDTLISQYRSEGLQVLGLVDYETLPGGQSAWTANNRENTGGDGDNNYIVGFGAITARIAQHYKNSITYYEVWNEPNCSASQPSPGVFTGCTFIYPSNFAAMLTEVYAQSKIYSSIPVKFVSGGLFGHSIGGVYSCGNAGATYLANTYSQGIASGKFGWARNRIGTYPLDAVGQHLYITQGGAVSTAQMNQYLDCIHNTETANDTVSKKTWVTEFGWNTNNISAAQQGQNITTAFAAMRGRSYVQTGIYFTNQDFGSTSQWGIWSCDVTQTSCQKASYANFHTATSYEGHLSNGNTDTPILNAFASIGQASLGSPFDNGGGAYVHWWNGPSANVQDFAGGSYGALIFIDGPQGAFFVNLGFRDVYINGGKSGQCGAPIDNAYSAGGGTQQDFVSCYMTWTPSTGIVVH